MDAENDNFFEQSNLSSASSSNSSSSNLLVNLPMLPILHAHDDDEDNGFDDDDDGQQQEQSRSHSQMPSTMASSSGGDGIVVSANNIASSSNSNNDTNNTHTDVDDASSSVNVPFNTPFLFNNHGSPTLSSSSSSASSSSSPPQPQPMLLQSQSPINQSIPSTSPHPEQLNQTLIHATQSQSQAQSTNVAPAALIATTITQTTQNNNNPITTTTTTTTTTTLFSNETTTEHLHHEHSPTPTFHQQHDSLQSTEHDDTNDVDDQDEATLDHSLPQALPTSSPSPSSSLVRSTAETASAVVTTTSAAGGGSGGLVSAIIDTETIADTIDVSAFVAPTPLNADETVRIDDDDDDIELDEVEPEPEVEEDNDDQVFASSSRHHRVSQSPLALGASTSAASQPPTSLSLLQTAPKHSNYTSLSGYRPSSQQQHPHSYPHYNQLHSSNKTPPPNLGSIFNFERNGESTMYGQGDGPNSLSSSGADGHQQHPVVDRLKLLYPNVNEQETPLPRCWSPHDKCLSIGLAHNNLRVHYKGAGKQHNDAASVRTAYPIPPSCGLYYFEVKIISKGKNGYMGIGLTAQQFRLNRLPGWDKQSYGYHGDDGNSFSSSGNGQSYGPTFTTGDVIGCCVNFVNNTCFYTKNGVNLGIAFKDLPSKLYPTVGLQTPGEEVDANFGQEPFKFDQIEDMMKQMREEIKASIYDFPMAPEQGDPTTLLHKVVSSYLVHNGYSQTAEAFARSTSQTFSEDMTSIRNRQKIIKLAMSGKMGQAIEQTLRSYPGLLENNKNLWFMLKCRQFIEMVNGSDVEQYCAGTANGCNKAATNSTTTQTTPPNQTSVIQSTKSYQNGNNKSHANSTFVINSDNLEEQQQHEQTTPEELKQTTNLAENAANNDCNTSATNSENNKSIEIESNSSNEYQNDIEMENNGHANGDTCKNGNSNNFNSSLEMDEEMEIDNTPSTRKYSQVIERILEFGKDLSLMGQQLEKENKMTEEERQMLEDAFSLIAYSNPWSSPLGWQLCPTRREQVCTALNSAILESLNFSRRPPLDIFVAHAAELLKVMGQASLGACAFMNIEDVFPQN